MITEKIKTLPELKKIVTALKSKGKKIAFTNGCFDILHYGHAKYLEDAKKKADVLIVAVNSDSSIRRIKGPSRPVVREQDRLRLIVALESVDYALLFNADTPFAVIKALKPDVLIKGADWDKNKIVGGDFVTSYGGTVSTVTLVPGRSTSSLIQEIIKRYTR